MLSVHVKKSQLIALIVMLWSLTEPLSITAAGPITATVETTPVPHATDAADDIAIWIHPTDPSLSTIIGTDKKGALEVYDLNGARLQSISIATNGVDLRYNFTLGGERIALVTTVNTATNRLVAYRVDPSSRQLVDVTDPGILLPGSAAMNLQSCSQRRMN